MVLFKSKWEKFLSFVRSKDCWRFIFASRPLYGLARVGLAVAFTDTPSEEGTDFTNNTVDGAAAPIAGRKPCLKVRWCKIVRRLIRKGSSQEREFPADLFERKSA